MGGGGKGCERMGDETEGGREGGGTRELLLFVVRLQSFVLSHEQAEHAMSYLVEQASNLEVRVYEDISP